MCGGGRMPPHSFGRRERGGGDGPADSLVEKVPLATHWTGGWVNRRTHVDATEKKKICCPRYCNACTVHRLLFLLYPTNAQLYRVIHKSLRNVRTRLRNNHDRHSRLDISSTCEVGQKLEVSLPLLTCSPSAWPSRLLYHRGRKPRRDLWITLYITTVSLYIIYTPECFDISVSSSGSFIFVPY